MAGHGCRSSDPCPVVCRVVPPPLEPGRVFSPAPTGCGLVHRTRPLCACPRTGLRDAGRAAAIADPVPCRRRHGTGRCGLRRLVRIPRGHALVRRVHGLLASRPLPLWRIAARLRCRLGPRSGRLPRVHLASPARRACLHAARLHPCRACHPRHDARRTGAGHAGAFACHFPAAGIGQCPPACQAPASVPTSRGSRTSQVMPPGTALSPSGRRFPAATGAFLTCAEPS